MEDKVINYFSPFDDSILQDVFNESLSSLNLFVKFSFAICGLFTLVYIGNILMRTWVKGEPLNLNSFFKPILIGIIITNFGLFTKGVDAFISPIRVNYRLALKCTYLS